MTLRFLFLQSLLLVLVAACGARKHDDAPSGDITPPPPPPKSTKPHSTALRREMTLAECRAEIAARVFRTAGLNGSWDYDEAELGPADPAYAARIARQLDRMPPYIADTFCSFDRIIVLDTAYFTGMVHVVPYDRRYETEVPLFLNRRIFRLEAEPTFSRQAQLLFTGTIEEPSADPALPHAKMSGEADPDAALFDVLVHETAHIIDAFNPKLGVASEEAGSFGGLSWQRGTQGAMSWQLRPEIDFPYRFKYSDVVSHLNLVPVSEAGTVFARLDRSNLVTTYACVNPNEDFAETVSAWVSTRMLRTKVSLIMSDGTIYGHLDRIDTAPLATKKAFVESRVAGAKLDTKHVVKP